MLIKLSSKNQITVPRLLARLPNTKYFEVELENGALVLKPVELVETRLEQIQRKMTDLGLGEDCVAEAIQWPIKIIKVVIDTNVLVSALLFGGTPALLQPLWKEKLVRPFISQGIIDEYLKYLDTRNFGHRVKSSTFSIKILPWLYP